MTLQLVITNGAVNTAFLQLLNMREMTPYELKCQLQAHDTAMSGTNDELQAVSRSITFILRLNSHQR